MPSLVLGPLQRGLGSAGLRIWVEIDEPCTVEVLGHRSDTWTVAGHHYALVELDGLGEGVDEPYDVRLDGDVVWPDPADGGVARPPMGGPRSPASRSAPGSTSRRGRSRRSGG